ncbi:MAG: undecaprenyl-diphosphate phosphatase [Planctomycetes bacterium]|nr:undecaprenyl-diphosphate phosphatase [Planctomycetota bacterium]
MSGPEGGAADLFKAVVLGVVEGLTEFLPVSSTGHLVLVHAWLGGSDPTLEVAIQMGAITAIVLLYWRRLLDAARTVARPVHEGRANLLWAILVAALPAALLGLLADDWIGARLFNTGTVAATTLVGGVLLLVLERWLRGRDARGVAAQPLAAITLPVALGIGIFQCLALVPGTSRSGATIAGALLLGLSRVAAAEFSFLVGLPILYGAGLLKLAKDHERLQGTFLVEFAVAALAAMVTAFVVVRPFVRFLQRHTFAPFAWYRIALGGVLLAYLSRS